ncbi:Sodium/hydrogen exchanger family-domain-containing protein [Gautieria morchelliformis]|nr:Sodium/hydrogen exchanger family-domain-containing protein [Gautieria morchelliformis]
MASNPLANFDGNFYQFNVTGPHIAYTCLGGFVVVFGMFSLFVREKLYIGEACWAFLFGVIIGPVGADIFNPHKWSPSNSSLIDSKGMNIITLEITRIVLAIGVFAIGVELPKQYLKKHWRSLFFLLLPIMTWGWFVSAGLVFALIPGLSFLSSLAVAACLTPTDPILAAAVIGGKYADKHVPAHLRHLLAAESGCNDGAAFPFLFIALYLSLDASDAHAVQDWFLVTVLYNVCLGVTFGSVLGFAFRHLMRFCERKDLIDRKSYVAQYVALALLSVGATTLLGSDDLLSAFASGSAFAWDGFFNKQTEDSAFSSVIDLLFNIAAFIYIGAWMPFHLFSSTVLTLTVWRLVVLGVLVLILRRLPIVLALYRWIPDIKTFREAVFSGHFGPIGVGAIFISTLAVEQLPHAHDPPQNQVELLSASIQPIVAFIVLCSVAVHGLSIPFFSLGRRVHSVSRTWSRHQSTDLALGPEWATQTTRVTRAEDVVVNRDRLHEADAMELGESEKVDSENITEISRGEVTPRDENPPDGSGRAGEHTEWREGPHLIIEHSHGPGNEVEVEVIRDAFEGSSEAKLSTAFRGNEASVRKEAGRYIQKITQLPEQMEKELGHKLQEAKDEASQVKAETQEGLRDVEGPLSRTPESSPHDENEREEDWRDVDDSDDTETDSGAPSSSAPLASSVGKKRSKSPKHKSTQYPVFSPSRVSAGKRRESFRRGVLTRPRVQSPSRTPAFAQSGPVTPESKGGQKRQRGRDTGSRHLSQLSLTSVTRPESGTHTPHDSISRLRHDSLRAASPSRSIRFADEQEPPGSQTPIMRPGTPTGDTPGGSAIDETTQPRVAFDVPHTKSNGR